MLLGTIFILALAGATGICFWTDAFQSLAWLWVFPVSFLGAVLIEAGIAFAVIMLMVKAVDFEKPQEKDSKPYRFVIQLLAQAAVPILSVRMHTEGLEKRPKSGRPLPVISFQNSWKFLKPAKCLPLPSMLWNARMIELKLMPI